MLPYRRVVCSIRSGPSEEDGTKAANWILRIAIALQCIGLFQIAMIDGTAVGTTLFMTLEWSEAAMLTVERGAAWALILAGFSVVGRPTRPALLAIAAWFGMVAALSWYQGGKFGYEYTLPAYATRILAPVALAVLVWPSDDSEERWRWTERVLRIAAATTFVAHGVEALEHHPRFIDYVITAFRRIDIAISEDATRQLLTAIGVQDLFLAGLILTRRWRAVALYMGFWGAITAGSRMVHMGLAKWPATLVRAANAGVPLALAALWSTADHDHDDEEQAGEPGSAG
jgi:hypothetical protein